MKRIVEAKRKKAAKPAAAATVSTIAVEPITRDGVVNEARTMRVYLIYFRRYCGAVVTADTPEWARLGIERLNTAIDAIDGMPGLEAYEFVGPLVEAKREYGERKAVAFGLGIAKLLKTLIARIAKATDRTANLEFYDIAEGRIASDPEVSQAALPDGDHEHAASAAAATETENA